MTLSENYNSSRQKYEQELTDLVALSYAYTPELYHILLFLLGKGKIVPKDRNDFPQ